VKLLLLAGTAEARALAERLAGDDRFDVIASLAGATRAPHRLAAVTRVGGFGGEKAQETWLQDNAIEAVVDATHPFASRISDRTQAICARRGLPYLQLLRPGWAEVPGDRWTWVADMPAAAAAIPSAASALLATGRHTLAAFAGRADATLYLRQIDPADAPFPLPRGGYVVARPPFELAEELRLFKDLNVNLLVVKDAGGLAVAKLAAARALDLPVIVVARPPPPPGDKAESVEAALGWLEQLVRCG